MEAPERLCLSALAKCCKQAKRAKVFCFIMFHSLPNLFRNRSSPSREATSRIPLHLQRLEATMTWPGSSPLLGPPALRPQANGWPGAKGVGTGNGSFELLDVRLSQWRATREDEGKAARQTLQRGHGQATKQKAQRRPGKVAKQTQTRP